MGVISYTYAWHIWCNDVRRNRPKILIYDIPHTCEVVKMVFKLSITNGQKHV